MSRKLRRNRHIVAETQPKKNRQTSRKTNFLLFQRLDNNTRPFSEHETRKVDKIPPAIGKNSFSFIIASLSEAIHFRLPENFNRVK